MTNKEKVKAYDKAIERANKVLLDCTKEERNVVEYLHPELIVSEDEKIRKALIEHFAFSHSSMYPYKGFTKKQIIAWLEKQGEQKPTEFDDTNAKRMFIKALERVEEQNNKGYKLTDCDKNSWWEDFKTYTSCTIAQNPVIEMKTPEKSLGVDSDTYNKIVDECIYGEQNHAWSEEVDLENIAAVEWDNSIRKINGDH